MKTIKEYHYVYKITNTNPTDSRKYYIGVRTAKGCLPEEDTNYWSSSKPLKESINEFGIENFSKEILSIWKTREEANAEEIRLHWEINVCDHKEYYNLSNAKAKHFCPNGKVVAFNKKINKIETVSKEDFDNSEYLVGTTVGKCVVVDKKTNKKKSVSIEEANSNPQLEKLCIGTVNVFDTIQNKWHRVLVDEYYNNDHLIIPRGVTVIDKRDNTIKVVSKSDFKKYDFYTALNKDKIVVIDIRDNSKCMISKDDYEKHDYYITPNTKVFKIFDNNNNLIATSTKGLKRTCESLGLPTKPFYDSANNNGKLIYSDTTNASQITFLKNKGFFKYKNWYAIRIN